MKLVRFGDKGSERAGILGADNVIYDVSSRIPDWTGATISNEILSTIRDEILEDFPKIDSKTRLGPPLGDVGKIIGCALTYGKHAQEAGLETPKEPMFMLTSRTAINGPFDDVIIPRGTSISARARNAMDEREKRRHAETLWSMARHQR